MPRPRADDALGSGSDSFLDIIANIVGILIILIVIAGVRVSRAPTSAASSTSAAADTSPGAVSEPLLEFANAAAALESETKQFQVALAAEQQRLAELAQQRQELAELHNVLKDAEKVAADRSHQTELRTADLSTAVERAEAQLVASAAALVDSQEKAPPAKTLEHRVTPISRTVELDDQRFFMVQDNRVAAVPLKELMEDFKREIRRQLDWLVRVPYQEGEIGPVGGFKLKYLVVRRRTSTVEDLVRGQSGVAIVPQRWELRPQPELRTMSEDEVFQPGSEFHLALKAAPRGSTVTIWVYPDSFPLFRRMQRFAHQQGLTVAAWPLPEGEFIQGSPNGSKSAAQ